MNHYQIGQGWTCSVLCPIGRDVFTRRRSTLLVLTANKKCSLFDELETRFGFVGGSYSNHVEYLNRKDMDPTLWHYVLQQDVQATAGISTVPKKSGRQRKLLMQCAANCMYAPADTRSSLGMFGGGALSQVYVPGGEIATASFDESNAFTAVVTPRWMWNWCAAPPVRAGDVWSRLSSALRGHCNAATWVSPILVWPWAAPTVCTF